MAFGSSGSNSVVGFIFGMLSSIGFSIFSVTLKMENQMKLQSLQQ